jgi:hypothetical protein
MSDQKETRTALETELGKPVTGTSNFYLLNDTTPQPPAGTGAAAAAGTVPSSAVVQQQPQAAHDARTAEEISEYEREHAAEIARLRDERLKLVEGTAEELAEVQQKEDRSRDSPLKRISRLTVGERIQLAMKGAREDRMILIRDGVKLVCMGVLESPKVSDSEAEMFAGMKNVLEDVLRAIARKRKYMKNYGVVKALVNNPRTPLDVGMPLVAHLLVNDLRALSINKNVSETIRKVAMKQLKEKGSTKH